MAVDDPVLITCAISGAVANREQCPAIPYTPEEYAAEARRAVDEGASMIHIHARTRDGRPSYEVDDFRAITDAITAEVDVVVNYSTGAIGVPVEQRIGYLRELRPDVAALNMGSMNYAKYSRSRRDFVFAMVFANPFEEIIALLEAMNEHGIKPEHECFDLGHIGSLEPLVHKGVLREPLHVSCVMGVLGGVPPTARNLAAMVDNVPAGSHWGVIGVSRRQWTLVAAALALGGSVRVGLEDNFYLPGAEVLKVEDTGLGDYIRWAPPRYSGVEPSAASAAFLSLNRGKRSIRLDLKVKDAREVLLRLVREHDVLLESFRPGVLDRLGVGWARLREENPRLVYCAITGYGQHGTDRDRPGHDIDYLARAGLLGLSGAPGGPPVQAAGQIADIGGGALMAAFGILAALRERERSGEGQLVDVAMTRGAQSWLALVAARYFADGAPPRRGELELAGGLACYRPYRCADGWVALGALEPKFWRALCAGLGREDLLERHMDPAVADELEAIFAARTRAEWAAFDDAHGCCLEPVLGLDEALARARARRRDRSAGRCRAGAAARPAGRALAHSARRHASGAGARRRHRRGAGGARLRRRGRRAAQGGRRGRRPRRRPGGELPRMSPRPGLKISELADASGVSAGTIKHYLREGLLGDGDGIVRTSRNMAWYPPGYVERIRLIKRLQEERFLPLRLIKELLAERPPRTPREELDLPANVLDRLAELGIVTPDEDGYDPDDVAVIAAIVRFREGGYDEALGFTVYDTLRYRDALRPLVEKEVEVLVERLGDINPERAVEIVRAGRHPLRDLIGAMHSKMLLEELRRVTSAGRR